MRCTPHEEGPSLAWLPGAWILVGAELLVGLYFDGLGPPPPLEWVSPGYYLDRSQALSDLAGVMLFVNHLVIVGVWIKYRSYRSRTASARVKRIACFATALSLILGPILIAALSERWALPPLDLRNGWERDASGFYHELPPPGSTGVAFRKGSAQRPRLEPNRTLKSPPP